MNKFKNKKIFITTYTPISKAFESYLSSNIKYIFHGFIDKNKIGDNVYKVDNILNNTIFDYIIIISPNHFHSIYEEYEKLFDKEKICIIDIVDGEYKLKNYIGENYKSNIKYYSELIDSSDQKRESIVFICKGFIDSNNKYFFLYCLSQNIEVCLITDNINQLEVLRDNNLPCALLDTENGDKEIAQAKYIVLDQANYTYFFVSKNQILIQLWHGVGLKKMSKLDNITYDYFISTSNWTNETNFKNIFSSKKYLNLGYPRNDIFFRTEDDKDLIFCDKNIYNLLKNKVYKKIVLYMPTFREYLFNKEIDFKESEVFPLNFDELNNILLKNEILFLVKFHPCVMEIFEKISKKQKFSNIKFLTTKGDIYPIIKYVDILITDYSSIAYDFLLLDRPIIFFDYDREIYERNMGGFLFDYDEFTPGIKVKNQDELISAIKEKDSYKEQRDYIKEIFFDSTNIRSSENIFKEIIK